VEGLFLDAPDIDALFAGAEQARREGVDAVFVTDGPLGDAIVLAAGLVAGLATRSAAATPDLLVGVRTSFGPQPHRHPTILAREMTTLDHVTGGRVLLALGGPFTDATFEAIVLCREMWSLGIGVSEGPHFPVVGAINRPLPKRQGGPLLALDLTGGWEPDLAHLGACDLVLVPARGAPPDALPPGVVVCRIQPCMAM
jgi:alkanesulfonate monooxygenase SsuD/methylene tetrahydromethanopterin reductase-like flavin-dependent oxidoreductase (luciferase family)